MPRHGQPGAPTSGTVIDRTRVEDLRSLDLAAPKVLRRELRLERRRRRTASKT